jgi:tetratricopeptide (TPR) repeat protein
MRSKIVESTIGIGILLILITFNPFIKPGLYLDSTGSYDFIASHKIVLLAILNFVLLLLWLVKIFKTKELAITSSKIYLFVFLWLISSVISVFFSINRLNSFLGFNATLAGSIIELMMLFIFFVFTVSNVRKYESGFNILRYFNVAISIVTLWFLYRFSSQAGFETASLKDYLNTYLFSPTGNYGSFITFTFVAFMLSLCFVITDILNSNRRWTLAIDCSTTFLAGIGFINFLDITDPNKNYLYIILSLLLLAALGFLYTNLPRLKPTFIPVALLFVLTIILGFVSYFGLTSKALENFSYPQTPIDISWNVTLDSIKSSLGTGIVGNGQGNFTYLFDAYKKDPYSSELAKNGNAPFVPEIRLNHAGSYILEVLATQGILGFLTFVSLIVTVFIIGIKKYSKEFDLLGISVLTSLGIVVISLVSSRYDFSLLFLFWILLAVNFVLFYKDDAEHKLNLSIWGGAYLSRNEKNFNFVFPLLMLIPVGVSLFYGYRITTSNSAAFWSVTYRELAAVASTQQNVGAYNRYTAEYQKYAALAVSRFDSSDTFIREFVNAQAVSLFSNLEIITNEIKKDPKIIDKIETIQTMNNLSSSADQLNNQLQYAINLFPQDYKNYFMGGSMFSGLGLYANNPDAVNKKAIDYFTLSANRNSLHAPTYYELAVLYHKIKNYSAALSAIQLAEQQNPNIIYEIKMAEILKDSGAFEQALNIYKAFKTYVEGQKDNAQLKNLYASLNLDDIIPELERKVEAERPKATTTPMPTQAPTITLTPKPIN